MLTVGTIHHSSGGNVATMSHFWTPSHQNYRSESGTLALHLVPGLEQMSRGETRKGLLLMSAAMFNLFFLSVLLCKNWLLTNAATLSTVLHTRVNTTVIDCLKDVSMRSPQMVSLCALLTFFIYLSIKDAKSPATSKSASTRIYPSSILEMSEAASGSYVLHSFIFFSMLFLVLFLIVPPAPYKQVTSIEFVTQQLATQKIIHSEKRSEKASEDSGRKDPTKQVAPSARGAQQPHQQTRTPSEAKTPSRAAPNKPSEQAANRTETQPERKPEPVKMQPPTSTTAPPPPTLKPPVPQPRLLPQQVGKAAFVPVPINAASAPRMNPSPAAPIPMAASSVARQNSAPPMPLIASAAIPAAQVGPLPTASSSAGKSASAPAPQPAALARGGSNSGANSIAAPPVRPATGTGTSTDPGATPTPVPGSQRTGGSHSSGNNAPTPKSIGTGSPGSNIPHWAFPTPVGSNGTADNDTGTTGTTGKDGPGRVKTRQEPNWGPYMADLQRRIKRAWTPPKYHESNRVVVVFKIHKNGELSNLRLVTSSGSAIVDQAAMRAVETAAPFRALPAEADDDIDVQFTFDYNLFNGGGSNVRF